MILNKKGEIYIMSNKVGSSENYVNPFETGYFETGQHDFSKLKNAKLRAEYCGGNCAALSSTENKVEQSENPLDEVLKNRRLIY